MNSLLLQKLVVMSCLFLVMASVSFGQITGCKSDPTVDAPYSKIRRTAALRLGDNLVNVNVYSNKNPIRKLTFVVLHHNEQTGLKIAKDYVLKYGGRLIEVVSCGKQADGTSAPLRNLGFKIGSKKYVIDPNRIFSEVIKDADLVDLKTDVVTKVQRFRLGLLQLIFPGLKSISNPKVTSGGILVSVHNNVNFGDEDNDKTNIEATRQWREINAEKIQKVDAADIDDFFLVTDFVGQPTDFYKYFSSSRISPAFNVAAQRSNLAELREADDGSLSVYCGINKIPYINVEAEHGHRAQQTRMLEQVLLLSKP